MKINPLTEAVGFTNLVRGKNEKDNPSRNPQQDHPQNSQKDAQKDQRQASAEQVTQAVDDFQLDTQAQAAGLTAVTSGNGPGLRVILKDGTGAVVRQFTGEEFLRLRDATSKDSHGPGKILDQKL